MSKQLSNCLWCWSCQLRAGSPATEVAPARPTAEVTLVQPCKTP